MTDYFLHSSPNQDKAKTRDTPSTPPPPSPLCHTPSPPSPPPLTPSPRPTPSPPPPPPSPLPNSSPCPPTSFPSPPPHTPSPTPTHSPPPLVASPLVSLRERCHCTLSDITPPPSYPVYDYLTPVLSGVGRQVDYVLGDGNCFFRCLLRELHGTEGLHAEFRQSVCDLIDQHPGVFAQYIDGGDTTRHVRELRKLGKWATTCEIYGSAALLQREVHVLTPIPGSEKLAPDGQDFVYRWLLFSPLKLSTSGEGGPAYLTLCNTNGNHYDRIAPSVAKCNCQIPAPVFISEEDSIVLDLGQEVQRMKNEDKEGGL